MADAESTKKKRTASKGQFTRYMKRLQTALDAADGDMWTIDTRYADFKQRWEKVQQMHDEYVEILGDESPNLNAEAEEQWITDLQNNFDNLEVAVGKKKRDLAKLSLQSPSKLPSSTAEEKPIMERKVESLVKIDRLRLPIFDGTLRKYLEFREDFMQQVEPHCGKGQLAFVLKQHLSEAVKDEINNVSDDYSAMWRRLDQKFGNIRRLVETILAEVKGISPKDASDKTVLKMIDTVEGANRKLQRMGHQSELHNLTTISIIEQAMTKEMENTWIERISSKTCTSPQRFKMLLEFLEDWRNRLEYKSAGIRESMPAESKDQEVPGTSGNRRSGYAHYTRDARQQNQERDPCWLHKFEGDSHAIWNCRRFKSLNTKERMELVRENKACQRCLLTTCGGATDIKKCNRDFKCSVYGCHGLHNALLHMDKLSGNTEANKCLTTGSAFNTSSDGDTSNAMLPIQEL